MLVVGIAITPGAYFGHQCQLLQQQNRAQAAELIEQEAELEKTAETIDAVEDAANQLYQENQKLNKKVESLNREVSRGSSGGMSVEVTAYTLSESSCGKGAAHPAYGLTASGRNLAGQSLESARAIAVDPRVIPLGSKVRLEFKDKDMQRYNGVYTAVDTGGAIKGNRIDLFAGEGAESLAMHIGRRQAVIQML